MMDHLIAKWTSWIEDRIANDVLMMHLRRHVWHRLGEIIKENDALPDSYFWDYLTPGSVGARPRR